jgi:hypothetical protein
MCRKIRKKRICCAQLLWDWQNSMHAHASKSEFGSLNPTVQLTRGAHSKVSVEELPAWWKCKGRTEKN